MREAFPVDEARAARTGDENRDRVPQRVSRLGGGQPHVARRGMVLGAEVSGPEVRIEGEVPLAETFGYSTDLRSMTQGPRHVHDGIRPLQNGFREALEEELIAERKKSGRRPARDLIASIKPEFWIRRQTIAGGKICLRNVRFAPLFSPEFSYLRDHSSNMGKTRFMRQPTGGSLPPAIASTKLRYQSMRFPTRPTVPTPA